MILLGSRALSLRMPNLLSRKCKDFDWVCTQAEFDQWIKEHSHKVNPTKIYSEKNKMIVEGSTNCEFEIAGTQPSTQMLIDLVEGNTEAVSTPFGWAPTVDMLFTIKASHKYLKNSPHFWKTAADYHLLKRIGAVIRPEYQEFFSLREKETYTYAHPKLNVTKENFFKDDGLVYLVEHDDIHESVKILERPAYTYYLKDGEQIQCDKHKFFSVDQQIRFAGVVEEAATLAIERSLLPNPGVWTAEYAWRFALAKVCSSITSGWFREFAYDNLPEIVKLYPSGFWEKFQKDLAEGRVRYIR